MSLLRPAPKPRQERKPPPKYLPKVNVKRAKKRRARDFGDIAEWLKTLPCCVCGLRTGEWIISGPGSPGIVAVIPSHVKGRGAGGRKHANQIPLACHLESRQHDHGWESIGLTKERAQQLATEYQTLYDSLYESGVERVGPHDMKAWGA